MVSGDLDRASENKSTYARFSIMTREENKQRGEKKKEHEGRRARRAEEPLASLRAHAEHIKHQHDEEEEKKEARTLTSIHETTNPHPIRPLP